MAEMRRVPRLIGLFFSESFCLAQQLSSQISRGGAEKGDPA